MTIAAAEVANFQSKAVQQAQISFQSIFPIATGGLPINPVGTAIPTGTLPIPTGSLQGVPSGVPLFFRPAGPVYLTRFGAGQFRLILAPATNGTVRAWLEMATTGSRVFSVTKRDIATGYVELESRSASGTLMDPANGDAIGVEYTAFSTGNAAGP